MPRPLRVEFGGATDHLMSRGDHREAAFRDDHDCLTFLRTLGEALEKTGRQVHAYCFRARDAVQARTYSMLNVEGRSASLGIPNHSGMVSLSKWRLRG